MCAGVSSLKWKANNTIDFLVRVLKEEIGEKKDKKKKEGKNKNVPKSVC